jgi:hypothetical protein
MVFIQPKTCSISFRLRWLIAYQRQRVHGTLAFANRRLFPAGLAMVVAALACSRLPPQPFGPTDFWSTSPNQFLLRAGLVLLAVGSIAHGSGLVRAHMWTNSLARETLLVYVVHVCLVYGSPWNTGLFQMRGHTMKLAPALAYVAALWIAMTLVATTWNCVKRHHPRRGAGAAGRVEALVVSLLQRHRFLSLTVCVATIASAGRHVRSLAKSVKSLSEPAYRGCRPEPSRIHRHARVARVCEREPAHTRLFLQNSSVDPIQTMKRPQ